MAIIIINVPLGLPSLLTLVSGGGEQTFRDMAGMGRENSPLSWRKLMPHLTSQASPSPPSGLEGDRLGEMGEEVMVGVGDIVPPHLACCLSLA